MAILIKNMEIPKCCADCPIEYDMMMCPLTGTNWFHDVLYFDAHEERLDDCPLIEIKDDVL